MCENRYSLLPRCPREGLLPIWSCCSLHPPAPSLPFSAGRAKRKEPAGHVLGNNYPPLGMREAGSSSPQLRHTLPRPPSSLHLEQHQSSPRCVQHGSLEQGLAGQLHHCQLPCRPSAVPGASLAEAQPACLPFSGVRLYLASGPPRSRGPWLVCTALWQGLHG